MKPGKSTLIAIIALATLPSLAKPLNAQFPPDSLTNLQVLPEDMSVGALINVMRGFSGALGVRCQYCHVGEANQPLAQFDFASDEKETKEKARVMLRMLGHINGEHLDELPSRSEVAVEVSCETCHRGQARPVLISDSLRYAYRNGGVDALETSYRELRNRYYGSHTYDFRSFILSNLANEMGRAGNFADVEQVMALNLEFFPDNPRVRGAYAMASVEAAMNTSGAAAGRAAFDDALGRFSAALFTDNALNAMGYRLLGSGKTAEAVEVFKINTELHPNSANAFDSLGEGHMNNGDRDEAIAAYEKSLELNPQNPNAVSTLERLRAN